MSSSSEPTARGFPWSWIRERALPAWQWLIPLSLVIAAAGGAGRIFVRAAVALFTLIAMRLWDDLEDVAHDRAEHPERSLGRLPSLRAARLLCGAAIACSFALIAAASGFLPPFAAAVALAFLASRARARQNRPEIRAPAAHIILLKVPALVLSLACADEPLLSVAGRAAALFGVVGGYEIAHDAEIRRSPLAPALAAFDALCFLLGASLWLLSARA